MEAWVWTAIGVIAGLTTAGVTVVSFWIAFAEKIATAKAIAEAAKMTADEAKKDSEHLQTQLGAHVGQFAIFREYVAREYVDRDVLTAMETRIMNGLKDVANRIDRLVGSQRANNRN